MNAEENHDPVTELVSQLPATTKAERKRAIILEAAIRIVRDGGVDSITHRSVAAEAGVPLGSMTYYFDSRESLISDAFHHYMQAIEARAAAIVQPRLQASPNSGPTLDTIVDILVETDIAHELRVVEYELILFAARDSAVQTAVQRYRLGFETQLADALENLDVPKPRISARVLLNIVDGYDVERLIHGKADERDLRDRLRVAVSGMAPAPRPEEANR